MIVCISDLHLKEEQSHRIENGADSIGLARNILKESMEDFFKMLGERLKEKPARQVDVVLAGDIFELNRSAMWFEGEGAGGETVRPYVANDAIEPGDAVETRALAILAAIAADGDAAGCLQAIREAPQTIITNAEKPDLPVTVHYLPGNHDRLCNATPAIRRKTRELLGIGGGDNVFAHAFRNLDSDCPPLVVRHGHEYDRFNFGADLSKRTSLPAVFDRHDYRAACFGDVVTLDVATRLPYLFRKRYEELIVEKPDGVHRAMYLHLLQFDDLRPQSAIVDYILSMPGAEPKENWEILRPVVVELLDELRGNAFLKAEMKRLRSKCLDAFRVGGWLLKLRSWRFGLSYNLLSFIANRLWGKGGNGPTVAQMAAKETLLQQDTVRFVIAGHTHAPDMQLLGNGPYGGRYYLDTGTWRDRILSGQKRKHFSTVRTFTDVVVCKAVPKKKTGPTGDNVLDSVELWTRYQRRWDEEAVQKSEINAKRKMVAPQPF